MFRRDIPPPSSRLNNFSPEYGGNMFLRIVGIHPQVHSDATQKTNIDIFIALSVSGPVGMRGILPRVCTGVIYNRKGIFVLSG
jgi:hypothetical protein